MKTTFAGKTARKTNTMFQSDSSTGHNVISLTPPDYGIDFVDSGLAMSATEPPVQRQKKPVEGKGLTQGKFRSGSADTLEARSNSAENKTGLPDSLKGGLEDLSRISLDDVRVHYNSSKPAEISAHAYTQGTDIHVAPGQMKHLPHEAWHVVQQLQGRVKPIAMVNDTPMNDAPGLENEAETMGTRAFPTKGNENPVKPVLSHGTSVKNIGALVRCGKYEPPNVRTHPTRPPIQRSNGNPMASLTLNGPIHTDGKSYANVEATATLIHPSQHVMYEIRWDKSVVPGGTHLGQRPDQPGDWIEDKDPKGNAVGTRDSPIARYWDNEECSGDTSLNGLYFRYRDEIVQTELNNGSWWFRLRVLDSHDNEILCSNVIEINWRH